MNPTGVDPWDVIVVGGGAAGLMACASAMRRGRSVLLLEKNPKLGVKILMSGGTRCNITHACDGQGIVAAFGQPGKFLYSALAVLPPNEVVRLIESQGVATKVEPGGKIFPVSDRAIDVRDALVRLASDKQFGGRISIRTGTAVSAIDRAVDSFIVKIEGEQLLSRALIIATGGKSYPGCGTTGDGYVWAGQLGHRIEPTVPALTPITNGSCWTHQLKGITLPDVAVKIFSPVAPTVAGAINLRSAILDQRRGGFLFTHFGYSGPAALDISRVVSRSDVAHELVLECDFMPTANNEQFRQELNQRLAANPRQTIGNMLCEIFPRRFVDFSLIELELNGQTKAAEVGKALINQLVLHFKTGRFPIDGVLGFKKAEVTAGGVDLDGIDGRTMQSRHCQGLYIVGEALDLDGPIGGYNFQAAFSTGWLAGMHV